MIKLSSYILLLISPFYCKVWGCAHSGVRYLSTYNTNIPLIRKNNSIITWRAWQILLKVEILELP